MSTRVCLATRSRPQCRRAGDHGVDCTQVEPTHGCEPQSRCDKSRFCCWSSPHASSQKSWLCVGDCMSRGVCAWQTRVSFDESECWVQVRGAHTHCWDMHSHGAHDTSSHGNSQLLSPITTPWCQDRQNTSTRLHAQRTCQASRRGLSSSTMTC